MIPISNAILTIRFVFFLVIFQFFLIYKVHNFQRNNVIKICTQYEIEMRG